MLVIHELAVFTRGRTVGHANQTQSGGKHFLDSLRRHMPASQAQRTARWDSTLSEAMTDMDLDDYYEEAAWAHLAPRACPMIAELVIYSQGPSVDGVYRRWDPERSSKGDIGRLGLIRHLSLSAAFFTRV